MNFSDLPITVVALILVIKMILDHKEKKKNGSSDANIERRNADRLWKKDLVDRLQAQTETLVSINNMTESTNSKCARIEKDTTQIKVKIGLGDG